MSVTGVVGALASAASMFAPSQLPVDAGILDGRMFVDVDQTTGPFAVGSGASARQSVPLAVNAGGVTAPAGGVSLGLLAAGVAALYILLRK